METKQYSTPQFDLIRRDETNNVFFQTSGGPAPAGYSSPALTKYSGTSWD